MKNKKYIIFFIIIFVLILGVGYYLINYFKEKQKNNIQEYIPQEEISEQQNRETIVTIYFPNKNTKKIVPEARMIGVKELIDNPYLEILNLLKAGPKNGESNKIFPDDIEFKEIKREGDILKINLSENFLEFDKDNKEMGIKAIKNTMTELAEINNIKILINGEEKEEFKNY